MAKRKRATTTKSIKKKILEGRCKDSANIYIPWYKVQDVASKGTSLKTYSEKTGRQHHLLSRLEVAFFLTLEESYDVINIKEQYAILGIDETIKIAAQLGYRHPIDPKTHNLVPITTDFLIEVENGSKRTLLARTVKYAKDLSKRTLQKFEIERRYWENKGVDWGIITDSIIDKTYVKNLLWIRKAKSLSGIPDLDANRILIIEQALWGEISCNNRGIAEIAEKVTNDLELQHGTGLFVVRHLLANKIWKVNMYSPIQPYKQIEILERTIPQNT
jgi:hypothetical protein